MIPGLLLHGIHDDARYIQHHVLHLSLDLFSLASEFSAETINFSIFHDTDALRVILEGIPEDPGQAISATATIPSLTNAVLTCSWGGTVSLMNTATEATVCHFITPPPYRVTTPWHPVFTVDIDGRYLFLQG
ncbi:UNVERIFIED_CONTAM: hypothetical protein K2H54_034002 [Gekko kuhli]